MISKEDHILLTAEKLFAEKGYDATTIREISKSANVNVSMISYYFGSKEKLFEKLFQVRMNEGKDYTNEILEKKDLNEWEKMSAIIDRYTERIRTLKCFYTILQTEQFTNNNPQILQFLRNSKLGYIKIYEQLINEGYKNNIFTKKVDVILVHTTLTGSMFYAMNGLSLYKEFLDVPQENQTFDKKYFEDFNKHIKLVLKNLLGYEENK